MAAPPKYPREHKEALVRLVLDDDLTIRAACQRIATGHNDLEPITIPEYTAGDWVRAAKRDDRPDLTNSPLPQILDTAARGLFDVVIADIHRMQDARGKAEADDLLTLARTLKELQPLTAHTPPRGKGNAEPTGVAGKLAVAPDPADTGNTQPSSTSPVSARSAS